MLIKLGQTMLVCGLRLAFPVVALLVMMDVAFALAGRVHAQLQLLALAFPAKMLAALVMLGWLLALWPRLGRQFGAQAWETMHILVRF